MLYVVQNRNIVFRIMKPFLLDVDILDVVDTFKVCLQKDPFFNNFLIDFLLIRQDGCSGFRMFVVFLSNDDASSWFCLE